jgi:hypothetical protein
MGCSPGHAPYRKTCRWCYLYSLDQTSPDWKGTQLFSVEVHSCPNNEDYNTYYSALFLCFETSLFSHAFCHSRNFMFLKVFFHYKIIRSGT